MLSDRVVVEAISRTHLFRSNEAHFACPDERGWMPNHQIITHNVKTSLSTTESASISRLPLQEICKSLIDDSPAFAVVVSNDPGRFICNYMYYKSLEHTNDSGCPRCHSLFVHVPMFSVCPKDVQLMLLTCLLQKVRDAIIGSEKKFHE
jgi:pyroglutamyl-peptidase